MEHNKVYSDASPERDWAGVPTYQWASERKNLLSLIYHSVA